MKTKLFLPFLLLVLAWTSCDDKETQAPPFLTIDSKTVNVVADGKTEELNIKTNVEDWTASVDPAADSWITVSKQESELWGPSLKVVISENDNTDSRKGEITVSANSITEKIVVEQLGQAPAILVSSKDFTVDFHGDAIEFDVTSNIDYEVIIPENVTWIQPKEGPETRGVMIKKEFKYDVSFNSMPTERNSVITIKQKHGSLKQEVTVTQKGQDEYAGTGGEEIKDDIKVEVASAYASSFQPGGEIEKSFDGDFGTLYHSNWNNRGDNYFPITLDYNFENKESIDYLVYHPRQSGPNGLFKETEIWIKAGDSGDFEKVMDFDFQGSSSATKVIFDKPIIDPKSVRFVVKSGAGDGQGFATCAEMEFYRVNPDNFDPLELFTDMTCSELKPGVTRDDIEEVSNSLYRNMALYMLNDIYILKSFVFKIIKHGLIPVYGQMKIKLLRLVCLIIQLV